MQEIESHPWFNGPTPTNAEYFTEMVRRKQVNDLKSQQERAQRQAQAQRTRAAYNDRRRGAGDDEEKEVEIEIIKPSKDIKLYEETPGQDIGFVICENPDTIVEVIQDYLDSKQEEEEVKCETDDAKYKIKITFEAKALSLDVKIFRINEGSNEFFVQFVKTNGYLEDMLTFKSQIEEHINKEFGYVDEKPED